MLQFDPNQRIKWNNIYDHELFKEKAGMGGSYNAFINAHS